MKLKLSAVCATALSLFFFNNATAQQGMGVGNANPQEMLDVTGAIKIGTDINNSNAAPTGGAGTIRFRAGQFEGWDGTSWIPLGGGSGSSPFTLSGSLVLPDNTQVDLATDDFIFGSPSLDDNGNTDNDGRFFYDKSKGAFRAGLVTGDQWNDIKRGNQSFAAGYDVTASGDYSIALGERSWAIAQGAIAMGQQAYAEGVLSFAWGDDVQATGTSSVALGSFAYATADYSYAVGANVNATEQYSMAVGSGTTASDSYAIALGNNSNATAESAFALGSNATASAWEAAAIGYDVDAIGDQSLALGHNLLAFSNYEIVLGRYNSVYLPSSTTSWQATDRLFTIGNGTSSIARSNALTILKNGNTGIGTSTPSATLHVDGSMRLVDGNQSNGYVLTSDGSGNATWQAANTGSDNQNLTGATLTGTNLQIDIEDGTSTTVDLSALVDDADADASNELQTLSQSGTDVTLSNGGGTISVADNDNDATNEIQDLSLSGNTLSLSGDATTVDLSGYVSSDDQNLTGATLTGTSLQIDIEGGSSTTVDLNSLVDDADADASNELQTLSQSGTDVTLSNGGGTISVADNDNDATNEIQTLSLTGNTLAISGSNDVDLSGYVSSDDQNLTGATLTGTSLQIDIEGGSSTTVDLSSLVDDADADVANELQTLSQSGTDVTLSNGGGTISVADNDNDASNEIQSLSISGNDITLSNGGGTVSIPNDNDWVIDGNDMYNANTGNIGLGDATPKWPTTVSSTNALFSSTDVIDPDLYALTITRPDGTNGQGIGIGLGGSNSGDHAGAGIAFKKTGNNSLGDLMLTVKSDATSFGPHFPALTVRGLSGNVGIGTTTPQEMLHVRKSGGDAIVKIESPGGSHEARMEVHKFGSFSAGVGYYPGNANLRLRTNTSHAIVFEPNGSEGMRVSAAGNVGVGATSPAEKLHVAGSIRMVDGNQQTGYIPVSDANGTMTWTDPLSLTVSALSDADADTKIQVEESADEDIIRFDTDGTERMVIRNDGHVGIGQSNPAWPATIRSDENIFSATNVIDPTKFAATVVSGTGTNDEGVGLGLGSSNNGSQAGAGIVFKKTTINSVGELMLTVKSNASTNGPQFPAMTIEPLTGNVAFGRNTNGSNVQREILIAGKLEGSVNPYVSINFQNFDSNSGATDYLGASIRSHNNGSSDDGDLRFFTASDQTLAEAMRIDHVGNVGVGTATPLEKLHVEGSVRVGPRIGVYNSGRSVFIGENAGAADDLTDNDNTLIGFETGLTVTTGYNNTAVGTRAFLSGNGYDNAAFGNWTLYSTTGVRNTALGSRAGQSIVGNENTIVGSFAGKDATGSGNVFLGHAAGQSESGDDKLYIENTSSNTPLIYGEFNNDIVAINGELGVGTQSPEALLHASSGSTGDANGLKLTQGTANSLIYHNSGNDLVIRKAAQTDQLVLDNGGNVGVGTSSPASKLHVTTSGLNGFGNFAARIENTSNFSGFSNGLRITAGQNFQTDNNRFISFRRPDGTEVGAVRQTSSTSVDFWSPSDQRLKTNIQATTKGLADLMQLQVKDYVYKDDPEKPQTGFIAQEVYEVFPNAVSVGGDDAKTDPWMMNYGNLTPLLVKAVQDLTELVEQQQQEIEALKAQR